QKQASATPFNYVFIPCLSTPKWNFAREQWQSKQIKVKPPNFSLSFFERSSLRSNLSSTQKKSHWIFSHKIYEGSR
ncbi:MAG: hypothetical protein KIG78_07005, partial [Bacteroidaceae bacterium]|nr:hypothetical protein [Bacteroidaceae bacterium]